MQLTQGQIYMIAAASGMKNPKVMAAIAMAESGGRTNAYNGNASTGDQSYGLWQINMLNNLGPARRKTFGITSNEQLFNPFVNALAAKKIQSGQGLSAWSVYTNGAYKKYLGTDVSGAKSEVTQAGFDWPELFGDSDPLDDFWDDLLGDQKRGFGSKEFDDSADDPFGLEEKLGDATGWNQLTRVADILAKAGDWLSDPANWIRIAYVAGGAALVIGGLVLVGKPLAEAAAKTTPAGTVAKFAKRS